MLFMTLLAQNDSGESYAVLCFWTFLISFSISPSIAGLRKQWCPDIIDLVERMWAQEHQDRPTMSQVVESLEDLVSRY